MPDTGREQTPTCCRARWDSVNRYWWHRSGCRADEGRERATPKPCNHSWPVRDGHLIPVCEVPCSRCGVFSEWCATASKQT